WRIGPRRPPSPRAAQSGPRHRRRCSSPSPWGRRGHGATPACRDSTRSSPPHGRLGAHAS
ncbi:MAG: hypothetical protein AVDCRST_MAG49-708, partial [uncultured Thermomicrobiales bacterium]